MGVGDYIHSKEGGLPRGVDKNVRSRHQRAESARAEGAPAQLTDLGAAAANGTGGPAFQMSQFPSQPRSLSTQPVQGPQPTHGQWDRGVFDTDVEEIDDSTVAGTSVYGVDENKSQAALNTNAAYSNADPQPLYQPRPARQTWGTNWNDHLGNQATKKTGFESDELEDFGSQITSSIEGAGGDDEKTDEAAGWSHKPRAAEEPLSKRLEKFWNNTRKRTSSPQPINISPDPESQGETQPKAKPRKLGQMLTAGPRKVMLPQNPSSTPRTRFSPPKPSLLEQLDKRLETSPTRQNSQPPPDLAPSPSISYFQDHIGSDGGSDDGMEPTIRASDRREVSHSTNAFDMTSLTDLDVDETINDPFFAHNLHESHEISEQQHETSELQEPHEPHEPPTRTRRNTIIHNKKRPLEADYPPEILYQKSFSDLQAEPFDKAPTPPPIKSPPLPPKPVFIPEDHEPKNAVSDLLALTDPERRNYLSHMTMDEWEDCGDQMIDRFTHLLSEMKNLRRARRHTAAVFEGEVRRRHDQVETQDSELTNKLTEMRSGGAEVLRGRYP